MTRGRRFLPILLLAGPTLFLLLFFAYPLGHVLSAGVHDTEAWSWAGGDYLQGRLEVAFTQAILSVALTMALALPLAYLHHRYHVPYRRLHLALHAAPFVLPVFVVVFGIQHVFGPNGFLAGWFGIDLLTPLGPLGAVVLAHAYYNYGIATRLLVTSLDRRPRRLEDAARVLGASRFDAFVRVSLPQLRHSLLSVALLVFLFTFTSFGVVLLMGAGRVSTLETLIYQNLGGAFPEYPRAAVLGILQLVINILVLSVYIALRKREEDLEGSPLTTRRNAASRHHIIAWGALVLGMVPALAVLAGGFRVRDTWTLEPWRALLDPTHPAHVAGFHLGTATLLSLLYAAATVLLAVLLTILLAYGIDALRPGPRRTAEVLGAVPLGTSSILVGLGFLLAFGADDRLDLRGTLFVIIIAHTLIAFPFVARVLLPAKALHDRRQDEAAALLGASPWEVFRRIHIPHLAAPILVAAGFAAAISLGDFGASLILMRTDNMSLAVWIGRHDRAFDPLMKAQATALAGVLMLLAAGAYLIVERFRIQGRETF